LEANRVAWGCSTRNGGQAQISAGRLKRSDWVERWGLETAQALHAEIAEAFELFRSFLDDFWMKRTSTAIRSMEGTCMLRIAIV